MFCDFSWSHVSNIYSRQTGHQQHVKEITLSMFNLMNQCVYWKLLMGTWVRAYLQEHRWAQRQLDHSMQPRLA